MPKLDHARVDIARKVNELRRERRLTQTELAGRLGLSQSRLSEIESGDGSFTAEQFLVILQLFNVTVGYFASKKRQQPDAALQNALARLGATHLLESPDTLPSERLEEAGDVVRETLIAAESPRQITALAPVVVRNIDRINFTKLNWQFVAAGLAHRLAWLIENIVSAVRDELGKETPRPWAQLYRRAELRLSMFVELLNLHERNHLLAAGAASPDLLDPDIRSRETLEEVITFSSDVSQRWAIATSLQPQDFVAALRAARAGT